MKQERGRRRQILELSRYGRVGGLHEWDDEPVSELVAWHDVLREMLEREDSLSAHVENR